MFKGPLIKGNNNINTKSVQSTLSVSDWQYFSNVLVYLLGLIDKQENLTDIMSETYVTISLNN